VFKNGHWCLSARHQDSMSELVDRVGLEIAAFLDFNHNLSNQVLA